MTIPTTAYQPIPDAAFAALGGGRIAYLRAISPDELKRIIPDAPDVAPGLALWGLLNADGTPILITDSREAALANARENELVTLAVN